MSLSRQSVQEKDNSDLKPGLVEFVRLGKTAHLGPPPLSVAQRQQGHAAEYQLPNIYAEQHKNNCIVIPKQICVFHVFNNLATVNVYFRFADFVFLPIWCENNEICLFSF